MKLNKGTRIFPGWWVLIASALASGLGGALAVQGASVLFKPVAADLNLTRAEASTAPAITALSSGVTFFLAGWLSDRVSPKWVVISGLAVMIAGFLGMRYVDTPWSYYLVWGVVVGAGQGLGLTVACDKAVTLWFARKQGLAMGLRFAIMGVVGMAALPLIAWLITAYGWRTACVAWAGVMILVIPLVIGFFKSGSPEQYGFLPDGLPLSNPSVFRVERLAACPPEGAAFTGETELTTGQVLKTRAYWLLTGGWIGYVVVMRGLNVHLVPFLTDRGLDLITASRLAAFTAVLGVPSLLLGGYVADRLRQEHLRYLLAGCTGLQALGLVVLLVGDHTGWGVYLFLALYGFGGGSQVALDATVKARYFGSRAFGAVQGLSQFLATPFGVLSPIVAGWVYDITGSYHWAMALFALSVTVGTLALCLALPPARPETVAEARVVRSHS